MRRLLRIPVTVPLALAVAALWWWAVLRLALAPAGAGPVEGALVLGGWGLGLLPVHCVPGPVRGAGRERSRTGATRASTLRRSGAGSGPS
ncbi:hypothetical protein QEZ40_006250 [Streptomyces katrae]|uniref:Uncharacterized protein n=1 Tax=Streptomyces katrae TaxID=68223 RepID=A0ABT7H5T6_9ACTN|nr:hypothetical protein [Streptomyces katrae]MDK9500430.1 hypothetical protein [Streptomyces katrae]